MVVNDQRVGRWIRGTKAIPSIVAVLLWAASGAMPAFSAEAPVTIKLWDQHVHDKKFRKDIFKQFNQDNPDIKVEYTSQVGSVYSTMVDAAFKAGSPPDIFVMTGIPAGLAKMVEMGWVVALDDIAPNRDEFLTWKAKFPPGKVPFQEDVNVVNGKTYSWPAIGDMARYMLYWNTKLFRDAGLKGPSGDSVVPQTWGDMRQYAKKITELGQQKVFGIVHGIKNYTVWAWDLFALAVSAGWTDSYGGFNYKTGSFNHNHPGLRAAIQLWMDMKKDGSIFPGDLSMDDEQAKFKFAQDLAGMIIGGWWVPGGLLAVNPSLEFDDVLLPTPQRGVRQGYVVVTPLAASSEYVVSAKVKSRDAAWKVVSFMISQQYQEGWVKAGGGISVFPEYNKTEFFPHPTLAKLAQMGAVDKRIVPEFPPGASKVWELWQPGQPDAEATMQGLWVGKLDWSAWDELDRRWNTALDAAFVEARKYGVNLTRADFTFPDWDPTKNYVPKKGVK